MDPSNAPQPIAGEQPIVASSTPGAAPEPEPIHATLVDGEPAAIPAPQANSPKEMTGMQVYNLVSDIGGAANFRKSDNLFQLKVIGICLLIGAAIGAIALPLFGSQRDHIAEWALSVVGVVIGGFLGVVVGLFGSGIYLMIYRLMQHIRGNHD